MGWAEAVRPMIKSQRFVEKIKQTWWQIQNTPEEELAKQSESGKMSDVWKILYAIWRQRRKTRPEPSP
jgi:hypothetical protein